MINESINPPTPADAGIFSDVCNVGGICEGWVQFQYWQNFVTQTMSSLLTSNQITQGGLTVFLTYDVCAGTYILGKGEMCWYWGLHGDTVFGGSTPQVVTWATAEYLDIQADSHSDVDVLSHEVGEWADDPYFSNSSPCDGFLEVGDPLEGPPPHDHTYGGYHLQDLVFLRWFGANIDTSVNNQWSFQNENLSVCTPPN